MGIPDYVSLHPDIAMKYGVPCVEYQTKDFFGNFGRLAIDREGRLIEHRHSYVPVQDAEPPFQRRMELGERALRLHGDVRILGGTEGGEAVDLIVRFTDACVTFIVPWDEYPGELKDIMCSR